MPGVLGWRGSKRECELLSFYRQRSTMHASINASSCGGTRQAHQHAVSSIKGACNGLWCPWCHLFGPELRHAAVASLRVAVALHAPALAAELTSSASIALEETWKYARHILLFEIHLAQRLPFAHKVSAQRGGSASQQPQARSVIQHASTLYHDKGLGQLLSILILRFCSVCFLGPKSWRCHFTNS
jgi:hypothetical protein